MNYRDIPLDEQRASLPQCIECGQPAYVTQKDRDGNPLGPWCHDHAPRKANPLAWMCEVANQLIRQR